MASSRWGGGLWKGHAESDSEATNKDEGFKTGGVNSGAISKTINTGAGANGCVGIDRSGNGRPPWSRKPKLTKWSIKKAEWISEQMEADSMVAF
jgi:hypothetical protein